ncbi:MAG: Demethyldecarbamoylnovobiocin O-methyltransferase [Actinobacteria bacterium ADurb.Bin444]|nr:MAG: Demethyldecarbamoylnovobiocin O-methyltransferase [Actinobacteria bacterium ADurb.Bin444]
MRLGRNLGDHPHDVLKYVLDKNPQGHAVEFGVYKGTTLALIAEHMPVTGFDSGQGLPEDWRPGFGKGRFAWKQPPAVPNADLVIGMFADTLPTWSPPDTLGLVHIDCDLYSSTVTVLRYLEPYLLPGCWIVFDEYHGYPGAEEHEAKAWAEFKDRTGIKTRVHGHGPEQLAIRVE